MRMLSAVLYLCVINFALPTWAQDQSFSDKYQDCYMSTSLEDTSSILVVGNSKIEWRIDMDGSIVTNSIFLEETQIASTTKESNEAKLINTGVNYTQTFIEDHRSAAIKAKDYSTSFTSRTIESSDNDMGHLEVEYTLNRPDYSQRVLFQVYPNYPIITRETYLKRNTEDASAFDPEDTTLLSLSIFGGDLEFGVVDLDNSVEDDYKFPKTVEFTRIDFDNEKPAQAKGNLFKVHSHYNKRGFIIFKNSQTTDKKSSESGYDFHGTRFSSDVYGLGLAPNDLPVGKWVQGNSVAVGAYLRDDSEVLKSFKTLVQKKS